MNLSLILKNNSTGRVAALVIIFLVLFKPIALQAQPDPNFILDHQDLIINVNNIATHGEISLRGLTANFPFPILSTISVVDSTGDIVIGLADTLRWLGPNDTAENGLPITQIWQPVLEYHEENHSFPPDPDIYNQSPEPLFTEVRWTEPVPTSTMLVMDVSTSMTEEIDDAKAGACLYVQLMRPVDRGGVVQFSGTVDVFQAMTGDTALLKQIINNAALSGGTAVYDGIMAAIAGIKSEIGRRAVIVYTDGRDNSSNIAPEAVIDSAQAYNLPVYTIALGNETDDLVLQQIADSTGGIFFKAATAEEMEIIYGKLSVLMQNYYVMAHASPDPFFNNTWRLVDVTVNLPNLAGRGIGRYFVGGPPADLNTDLAANIVSVTDTVIEIAGNSINAVKPGETYEYLLTMKNLGPNLADTVRVVHFLPDSVRFLNASISPDIFTADSLEWEFTGVVPQREFTISVNVQLKNNIPRSLTDLISEVRVSAINDTNSVNNFDFDTVKVLFPKLPDNYDLSLTQQVFTDTSIDLAGKIEPAVIEGDSYHYLFTIKNLGPLTAHNFTLQDAFPDSVIPANFSITPIRQTPDSLFWQFDSLTVGDSIKISFEAIVADSLPFTPFPLFNTSELVAANDTTADNDFTSTTVYGIEKPEITPWTDLAIKLISETDTSVYVNNDSVNAVFPGDNFSYLISVSNLGTNLTDTVRIIQQLPDSVYFINTNFQTKFSNNDSLKWEFYNFQPGAQQVIQVNVRLANTVPKQLTELISEANLFGTNDSTLSNNSDNDTVYVIFEEPQPTKNYDLSLSQVAITDTNIYFQGDSVKAVLQGDVYSYSLSITNSGPATAYNFTLLDVFPDSTDISGFNIVPIKQNEDTLFWQFDSLIVGDSILIKFDATAANLFPFTPYPLINQAELIAENDTMLDNNSSSTTVYAIKKPEDIIGNTDLSLAMISKTDTFAVVNSDSVNAVFPGDPFSYLLTIANLGSNSADTMELIQLLPDSVDFITADFSPQVNNDSLVWKLSDLKPLEKIEIKVDVKLKDDLPEGFKLLISEANLFGSNDTTFANNFAIDSVHVLTREAELYKNYDLSLSQVATTDTNIYFQGDSVKAVLQGDVYSYSLTITNSGPTTAYDFTLLDIFPDSTDISGFNILPSKQTVDTLFWHFDSLIVGNSILITFDATTANLFPFTPYPLINRAELIAENDTLLDNNSSSTTVYAIKKPADIIGNTDLLLAMTSKTDTFAVVNSDSVNAVYSGDPFSYLLTIANLGSNSADTMKLIQLLPDSVDFINAEFSPQLKNNDSLIWVFSDLRSQDKIEIQVDVKLKDDLPEEFVLLISEANLFGSNDTTFTNNFAIDTVQILSKEAEPYKNHDLSLSQSAITDTSIWYQGDSVKAVLQGDVYSYSLSIANSGPITAYNITLWDVFPDSVRLSAFNIQPSTQAPDSLFWFIDSLIVGDTFNISFNAELADTLPVTPFPLINESGLIAQNDTLSENNFSTTTVYGIRKKQDEKPDATDVALAMFSLTDTSIIVDQNSFNAVKPGEKYQYLISIKNNGFQSADSVNLVHLLPDSGRFLEATSPAQISNRDSLLWEFENIQPGSELSITVSVQLSAEVPKELGDLISNAVITAANDSTLDNNSASDTVKVLFPESPINLNYNLATRQQVFFDTSIVIAGETMPAVVRGESYRYDLIVKNYGPATARDFALWDAIPDSILITDLSIDPFFQTRDSLFWQFDSLSKGDSIIIALDVAVSQSLPFAPFPLFNETGLIADNDTSETDNYSSSLIYAIARPDDPQASNSDISACQSVVTDSFAVAGNDTLRFARTGETYFYKISVTNVGLFAARNVKVIDILPDSITASNFQPMPETIMDDSLLWQLGILLPQTSVELLFNATVASDMPIGKNYLRNEVEASASNEDPTRLSNNNSTSTVINLVKPGWDWQPYIEAMPQVVKVGNPITVRVQVTAPIDSWDLWVYLANGQIDSIYGDDFIASIPLAPDVWSEIDPAYLETKLYTEAKKEEIVFELRARDVFGELKTAEAAVTIESDDDLIVDRNVFIPDKENELPIKFKLSSDREVRLEIYDITGTKITNVADGQFKAGWNIYAWNGLTENGQKIGSGFYILTIRSGEFQAWKKLMIVR